MSPLSVAKVTSNLASGSISMAGALGMAVLRYRPCRPPSPSTPASAVSCATCSRSSAPTRRPSARGGPPRTWPPTSWCGSATPPPARASSSAALRGAHRAPHGEGEGGAATARLVDRVRNGPPLGPFAVPGPAHAASTSRSTWCTTRTCAGPTASGPRTDRPDLDDALWGLLRRGARLLLPQGPRRHACACSGPAASAVTTRPRPGGRGHRRAGGPAALPLRPRRAPPQVEITGDPDAQPTLAERPKGI